MRSVVRLKNGKPCHCADALLAGAANIAWCRHRDRLFGRDHTGTIRSLVVSRQRWDQIVRGIQRGAVRQSLRDVGANIPIVQDPKAHPILTCAALLFGADPADLKRPGKGLPSVLQALIHSRRTRYWHYFGRAAASRKGAAARAAQTRPASEVGERERRRRAAAQSPAEALIRVGLSGIAFFPCESPAP